MNRLFSLVFLSLGMFAWSQYAHEGYPLSNLDNLGFSHRKGILTDLDLQGRVYTIRVDETRLTKNGNRWVEGRRNVRFTALFDEEGRLAEESWYDEGSNLIRRGGFVPPMNDDPETFQLFRNRAQRLLHSTPTRNPDGTLLSETLIYADGGQGVRLHSWSNGRLMETREGSFKERFRFDNQGRILEIHQEGGSDGSKVSRFEYDSEGRLARTQFRQGSQEETSVLERDSQGRLVKETLTREGNTFIVEYTLHDAAGNWQRRHVARQEADGSLTPLFVRYRRINYY